MDADGGEAGAGTGATNAIVDAMGRAISVGLPTLLAGPAGDRFVRWATAGLDIRAARKEQIAQEIRDETAAKSLVMQQLAASSAALATTDEVLLRRGLSQLLNKAYREQERREGVAKAALAELDDDKAPTSEGPSEEWYERFDDVAVRASSDELKVIYGRALAGEIRKPGTFSFATLHALTLLDQRLARRLDVLAPILCDGAWIPDGTIDLSIILELQDAGFLQVEKTNRLILLNKEEYILIALRDGRGLVIDFVKQKIARQIDRQIPQVPRLMVPGYGLTRVGRELLGLSDAATEPERLAKVFRDLGASRVRLGVAEMAHGFLNRVSALQEI